MRAKDPQRFVTALPCFGRTDLHRRSPSAEAPIRNDRETSCIVLLLGSVALLADAQMQSDSLKKLADDFWAWRAKHAPFTGDDVNRMERPDSMRDWSQASIETRRKDLATFEERWKKIDATHWPIPRQIDYRLTGSALSRVRWELDINPRWRRDPTFYIEQTLTPIAEALIVPALSDEARSKEILNRIETFRQS